MRRKTPVARESNAGLTAGGDTAPTGTGLPGPSDVPRRPPPRPGTRRWHRQQAAEALRNAAPHVFAGTSTAALASAIRHAHTEGWTTPDYLHLLNRHPLPALPHRLNPDIEALGVVLFGITSTASAVRRKAEADVSRAFGTSDVLFHTAIRHSEKVAQDCRERGQLVIEYEADLDGQLGYWAARKAGKELQRLSAASRGLAEDQLRLTEEIVARRAAALDSSLAVVAR